MSGYRWFWITRPVVSFCRVGLLILITLASSVAGAREYSTTFPTDEAPLSEDGNWINGETDGLLWKDFVVANGVAYGTQDGAQQLYDDSTALVTGTWGADQIIAVTAYVGNTAYGHEIEIRLRSEISANRNTGYEILYRPFDNDISRISLVRWNGALGDFTLLKRGSGTAYGVKNGDILQASMIGNTITAYINGVQKLQVTDNTFSSGKPGIGHYVATYAPKGSNAQYGFTSFTATSCAGEPDGTSCVDLNPSDGYAAQCQIGACVQQASTSDNLPPAAPSGLRAD